MEKKKTGIRENRSSMCGGMSFNVEGRSREVDEEKAQGSRRRKEKN